MIRDKVAQLHKDCRVCGRPMWLVHNTQTRRPKAWFCEPCYRWFSVEGEDRGIDKHSWDEYRHSDPALANIKHGTGLGPAVADINRGGN